jgi:hypothetical protein
MDPGEIVISAAAADVNTVLLEEYLVPMEMDD